MKSFNSIKAIAAHFSIFIQINRGSSLSNSYTSLSILLRNQKMSKSLTFIILALLVVANTKNMLISASSTGQGSDSDALSSINPAASPEIVDCSGLTREECLIEKLKKALADYIYYCPPGGCK